MDQTTDVVSQSEHMLGINSHNAEPQAQLVIKLNTPRVSEIALKH